MLNIERWYLIETTGEKNKVDLTDESRPVRVGIRAKEAEWTIASTIMCWRLGD